MAQLTYDEIRLLRDLKNSSRKISSDKPHGGLNQLAKEGYVTSQQLNISETLYSITAKGLAALHDAEGND
jgi:DNA-binding PadR family transcriptional regulator